MQPSPFGAKNVNNFMCKCFDCPFVQLPSDFISFFINTIAASIILSFFQQLPKNSTPSLTETVARNRKRSGAKERNIQSPLSSLSRLDSKFSQIGVKRTSISCRISLSKSMILLTPKMIGLINLNQPNCFLMKPPRLRRQLLVISTLITTYRWSSLQNRKLISHSFTIDKKYSKRSSC